MYINSVKVKTNELVIAGCNLLLICNDSKSVMNKNITFPNGYQLQDTNIIFKVNFKNGCATDTEPSSTIKLNDKKIFAIHVSNKELIFRINKELLPLNDNRQIIQLRNTGAKLEYVTKPDQQAHEKAFNFISHQGNAN